MQKYVVDLETAKKLKGYLPKGWEGEFVYGRIKLLGEDDPYSLRQRLSAICTERAVEKPTLLSYEEIPAPILEEMLELLPNIIYVGKVPHYLNIRQKDHEKEINYIKYPHGLHGNFESETFTFTFDVDSKSSYHNGDDIYKHICTNGAAAAAKLYMWLVDEGYHIP
jgi:hypothetical protein